MEPSSEPASEYASVSRVENPSDPIPSPSQEAIEWAQSAYNRINQTSPSLVKNFEERFHLWREAWDSPILSVSSLARDRCHVEEFHDLVDLGPRIIPLVIYKLLDGGNFTAVFLYNELETDKRYLIDPSDVLNFLVLKRQQNLIVDINRGRE